MVTSMLRTGRRLAVLGLLLGLAAACRTTPRPLTLAPMTDALPPDAARARAKALKDDAEAAELLWLYANDRKAALLRLERGLQRAPQRVDLRLRRALLRHAEMDLEGAVTDLAAIVQHGPDTPQAEIALALLHDWLNDVPRQRQAVEAALVSSGLLEDQPSTASRMVLASALATRLARSAKDDGLVA